MSDGFNQQLKDRMKNDNFSMKEAFYNFSSIVKGERKGPKFKDTIGNKSGSAIEQVLTNLGVKIPSLPKGITDLNEQLEYMLRASGVMRRRVELKGSWWKDGGGPLLGSTTKGEVIAILPGLLQGYIYYDPDTGNKIPMNKKTAKNISIDAFCFYKPFPARKLTIRDLLLYIAKCITYADIAMVIVASLLVSLLGMFTPYMNKQIFDSVIPSGTKEDIVPVGGLLVGAAIGTLLFGITRSIILNRFRDKINTTVQGATMARIFSLPATFFKEYSSGELSSRSMSINHICSMLSDTVLTSGLSAIFSIVYIFQMVRYAPSLVKPGLIIILSMLIFTILTVLLQQKITKKKTIVSAKISGLVYGLFSGIQKFKLAGAEKRAFSKWADAYKEEGRLTYSPPLFLKLSTPISAAMTLGGGLIIYYFAGKSQVSPSDYIAFNTAYGSVSSAIMQLSGIVTTLANIKPHLDMVKPILNAVPEIDENKKVVTQLSGEIELNNITFRYVENGPAILDNVSFKVKKGEYVALVGKTGCGKSTLMRLMLGFEKPEAGAIYYDGNDLESLDVPSVRKNIGVVLQNGKLFSGDIFSNIIITAPWLKLEDAWKAARLAGLDNDIKAMPMGMHTMISEGSGGISGGQKQRIMIARAIVSKPNILFFDEATSALDNITQKIVSESVSTLNCTRIVIAHRLSTIKMCDRILVLDKGKIVEEGNFEELMAKEGLFYEFASRQMA
ncbi:alpha-hemolysin translocation ATP-binding protein HlyB [Clostridium homopropionicum DSM 5847]|uniref:Alpha-hemolysin translocation ATP-binding protein HlyB n=1 Tax=Clostridium homopropionicum DSM 5847 TaxID=1121318 RepID=A0A0L6ZAT9_9CLOT|nr:NHLP bacteriocin export ABC transporter permease/ATPase subunit [Clostridium homopropionicum]KOA20077.1 alpha-hemolysin translocation ATP-binding protein HlyB [Clostridium homopropionicum DSM 5847]SFG86029.1 NHLM bacteriocin system ABC transporter, ATP-binding protein [Clostridium homopropionicum]